MIRHILIAIQFLTRRPVPRSLDTSEDELGQAAAYFPLVGVIVGLGGALVYACLSPFLPSSTCVVAVLIYFAWITNGLHEDGLADTFDGFGGGWTRDDVLRIMRDSRIGTYGGLALIFLILVKYNLLTGMEEDRLWRWLVVAHTACRWTILLLSRGLPYARAEGQGKLVARRVGLFAMIMGTITLLLVLLLLPWQPACATLATTSIIVILSGWYYRNRLQGITGDCLGATSQFAEVGVYMTAVLVSG